MSTAIAHNTLLMSASDLNTVINLRGFAQSCGCGDRWTEDCANIPFGCDCSLVCVGNYSAIVSAEIPEIKEALEGDMDHIVERITDATGTVRTVIWRRDFMAPHFIELGDGFYLAPYWTD